MGSESTTLISLINKAILNELANNGLLDDVMDKLKEADLID